MLRIQVLFISKILPNFFCACVRNTPKTVTFVIGKMKLVFFSLFLDAPQTQDALWTTTCRYKHLQHMHWTFLGLRGKAYKTN